MFIKRGGDDGKILSVVDDEELTADQKKKAESELAKQVIKKSNIADKSSDTKKSGS